MIYNIKIWSNKLGLTLNYLIFYREVIIIINNTQNINIALGTKNTFEICYINILLYDLNN